MKLICVIGSVPNMNPLLTHYKSNDDVNHMIYAIDETNQLIFDISSEYYIFEYVSGKTTLRELILSGTSYRLRQYKDIGTTSIRTKDSIMTTEIENVPEEYLPSEDSYFGFKIPEAYDHFVVDEKISKMLGK